MGYMNTCDIMYIVHTLQNYANFQKRMKHHQN